MRRNFRAGAGASTPCVCHLRAPVLDTKALGVSGETGKLVVYELALNMKTTGLSIQGDGLHHLGVDTHSPASVEEVTGSLPLLLGIQLRVGQAEGKPR